MAKGFVYTSDSKNKYLTDIDKAAANIKNVLLTRVGTRPNLPFFGSKLYNLEYYPMDQILVDLASLYIREAIANSMDGVVVNSIKTTMDKSLRMITFHLVFSLQNGTTSSINLFYDGEKFK